MITEDIHWKPSLILLPSPWSAPTPDCHDSWTLTFDSRTAPMALLALTQKYHWAIWSQSVRTKYCVMWVNRAKRKTKHPCNGAPWRWVIDLTVKDQTTTRRAFFIPSHQRNAMAECQTTAATLEMGRGGALSWLCKVEHKTFVPFGRDAFT